MLVPFLRSSKSSSNAMARAPSYQQERKNTNKKPYANSNHPCSSSSASGSISKLKGSLRSAKRLLLKDGLDAALRVETERRVESLQAELKEAEAKRPSSTTSKQDNEDGKSKAKAAATNASTESKKPKGSSSKDQIKKNEKRQNVYKMLRHVEYQKTRRRFKTASKELASIAEKLQALDTNRESMDETASKTDKKARKSLEKQLAAREEDVLRARIDSWYVNVSANHIESVRTPLTEFDRPFRPTRNTLLYSPVEATSSIHTLFLPCLSRIYPARKTCSSYCHRTKSQMKSEVSGARSYMQDWIKACLQASRKRRRRLQLRTRSNKAVGKMLKHNNRRTMGKWKTRQAAAATAQKLQRPVLSIWTRAMTSSRDLPCSTAVLSALGSLCLCLLASSSASSSSFSLPHQRYGTFPCSSVRHCVRQPGVTRMCSTTHSCTAALPNHRRHPVDCLTVPLRVRAWPC